MTKVNHLHMQNNAQECVMCAKLFTDTSELDERGVCLDCEIKEIKEQMNYGRFAAKCINDVFINHF
jgi:hypothetical protein